MANPSIKNGYLKIANELAEQFSRLNLAGLEWRLLFVVLRKTWGWHGADGRKKDWDWITYGQMEKQTGISRRNCIRYMKRLVERKIILSDGNGFKIRYKFNQDYEGWVVANTPPVETPQGGGELTTRSGGELTTRSGGELTTHKRKERNINKIQKKVIKKSMVANELTPRQIASKFFQSENMQTQAVDWLTGKGVPEQVARSELQKFLMYWTEPNSSGTKQRWELEKAFEINRRLATWFSRIKTNSPRAIERKRKVWNED